jgi:protein tyrosine/serine phosphatase
MAARFPGEGRTATAGGRCLLTAFAALLALLAAGLLWDFSVRKNFDTVVPGRIYRSGQPGKSQLERWIRDYGLQGILTLRHGLPSYERELAGLYGVKIFHVPFSANSGPSEKEWDAIREILTDEQNLPLLLHCRGGGDRTAGLAPGEGPSGDEPPLPFIAPLPGPDRTASRALRGRPA